MKAYHFTSPENIYPISVEGLRMPEIDNSDAMSYYATTGLSGLLSWDFRGSYPVKWPIFLALPHSPIEYFYFRELEIIEVDITGYDLWPDLPTYHTSVVNYGDSPDEIYKGLKMQLPMSPTNPLSLKAIERTGTIAICQNIPPERIRL